MTYTFYHSGILIGESDLEDRGLNPGQRGGVFRPTPYGLDVFPRLTGVLTAGHALKTHLDENGLDPDTMGREAIEELLDTNPAGQKIIDIGRMLSEVEIHKSNGKRVEFKSIAFIDLDEFKRVGRELGAESESDVDDVPPDRRYVVSATLRKGTPDSKYIRQKSHFDRKH